MSEQPKALRLADALENLEATGWGGDCFALTEHSEQQAQLAAAELRRLSAENERLHQINQSHEMKLSVRGYEIQIADLEAQRDEARRTVREAHEAGTRLTAQRDALLEALRWIGNVNAMDYEYQAKARTAIKAVEGEKE